MNLFVLALFLSGAPSTPQTVEYGYDFWTITSSQARQLNGTRAVFRIQQTDKVRIGIGVGLKGDAIVRQCRDEDGTWREVWLNPNQFTRNSGTIIVEGTFSVFHIPAARKEDAFTQYTLEVIRRK